jgi:hypothetical protein
MGDGKDFRLADEIRHIQRCAARQILDADGDAWLLDKEDGLAAP